MIKKTCFALLALAAATALPAGKTVAAEVLRASTAVQTSH